MAPRPMAASISRLTRGTTSLPPRTDRLPLGSTKSFWTSTTMSATPGPYRCIPAGYRAPGDASRNENGPAGRPPGRVCCVECAASADRRVRHLGVVFGRLALEADLVLGLGRRGCLALDVEEVADALEGPDAARLARLRAELPAHPRHPHPQVLEIVAVLGSPHLREELGVEDDLPGVCREVLEEQPFGPRELHELAATGDHPALEIDLDVVELDHACARLRAAAAADDGADARRQLVRVERLRDVVVGAEVEALGLVGGRAFRREEDDGHRPALTELPHDLDPVEIRHHDVEEDDVRSDLLRLDERLLAAVRRDDPEALFRERDRDELRDPRLVVGDEDEWLCAHATPPLGPAASLTLVSPDGPGAADDDPGRCDRLPGMSRAVSARRRHRHRWGGDVRVVPRPAARARPRTEREPPDGGEEGEDDEDPEQRAEAAAAILDDDGLTAVVGMRHSVLRPP